MPPGQASGHPRGRLHVPARLPHGWARFALPTLPASTSPEAVQNSRFDGSTAHVAGLYELLTKIPVLRSIR